MSTDSEHTGSLARLLHLTDSAFPTGGYAHSLGLEEIVRDRIVFDEASLLDFLDVHIRPALEHMELPLVREAHSAAASGDLSELIEIDTRAGALRLTRETRDASCRIGCRRLAVLLKIGSDPFLESFQESLGKTRRGGHHVTVFGAACRNLPLREVLTAYYYHTMAGTCTASLKLFRIGQEGVHRALARMLDLMDETLEASGAVPRDEIGWLDPMLDLASMHHEIAEERLFIS